MRPVSAAFLAAIAGSHAMVARARVVAPGQTGVNPTGVEIPINAGDVQLDATANIRSTVDVTTDGNGWEPRPGASPLQPYGAELFVERGVVLAGGRREWVSLGYHKMYSVEQEAAPDGPLRITAKDRMAAIIDARLTKPVQFKASDSIATVFSRLVREVYPSALLEYDWNAAADLLGVGRIAGGDSAEDAGRYEFLRDLATSRGKVMYWDYRGVLRVRSAPDPQVPVWQVQGGAGGVLVSASRGIDRDGVYNAVVAYGESTDDAVPPVRAVVVDADPASPTYWNGPFGQVPRFYSSPLITTARQARSAGAAILQRYLGLPYNVDFTAVPNPALEPLDPIWVRYSQATGRETHVIEKLTIPLVADAPLTAATRKQTAAGLGLAEDGEDAAE